MATIRHLSEGRLTLGVGVGWIEQEFDYLHATFDQRGKIADEYIAAMRELFQTDDPEYHGTYVDYAGVLFTPRPRTPLRIVVGGSSAGALRRAATLGDGWHGLHLTPQEVQTAAAALDQHGRKPGFSVSLRTRTRITRENMARPVSAALVGTADQLAAQAERYAEAGVDQLVIEPDADELGDFLEQMTQFADQVANRLPALSVPIRQRSTRRSGMNVNAEPKPGVALVTGATSGFGREVAPKLAAEGYFVLVLVHGRNAGRGEGTVRQIEQAGGHGGFISADLTDVNSISCLADQASDVDVLVNNAGMSWFGPTQELDPAAFDKMFAANVRSAYYLVAAIAPRMAKRGTGSIINLGSMAGQIGLAGGAAYGATKAALASLTRSWAAEFSPQGVRVNAIAPGPAYTDGADADRISALGETTLLARAAQPWPSRRRSRTSSPSWPPRKPGTSPGPSLPPTAVAPPSKRRNHHDRSGKGSR